MLRLLTRAFSLTTVFAVFAFLPLPQSDTQDARASDVELVWGNWLCAADDPQSIDNFNAVLEYIAELDFPQSACPVLGTTVALNDYGEQVWGDEDCDGDIDGIDALHLLLWYEDLDDGNNDCPDLGDGVVEAGPKSDWQADAIGFEVIGPYASGEGAQPQGQTATFNQNPTLIREDFFAHNDGPEESGAIVTFEVAVTQGSAYVRWISQSQCLTPADQDIPCGEATNGQQEDTCLDDVDNDGDQDIDEDDTDCVEVRKMAQSVLQPPGDFGPVYHRFLTIRCFEAGPLVIEFRNEVQVLPPNQDPFPTNNEFAAPLNAQCSPSKQPLGSASADSPGPYAGPGPYLPQSFPQSGGPPESR